MKHNYCTIFDKGFLNRGLSLYNSVKKHSKEPFRHFILCVDDTTFDILTKLALPSIIPIRMTDFEASDPKILQAKNNRKFVEYMWTLSSVFTSYVLKKYSDCEYVTYLDADLYFYQSPEVAFDAMGDNSTLIIPHNLPPGKKHKEDVVGKYNVGMLIFKNDTDGRETLAWWTNECLTWCYEEPEPGKFGDQKYLDFFEEKFKKVFVFRHNGADLAGWNIKNFTGKIYKKEDVVMIDGEPLIFFHFSSWRQYFPKSHLMPFGPITHYNYIMPSLEKIYIFNEYAEAMYGAMNEIRQVQSDFIFGMLPRPNIFEQLKDIVIPTATHKVKGFARKLIKK